MPRAALVKAQVLTVHLLMCSHLALDFRLKNLAV